MLISGRIEIIIDLTDVEGDIIMTNDAAIPYPDGDAPDRFTSQILKIEVKKNRGKGRYLTGVNFLDNLGFGFGSNRNELGDFSQSIVNLVKNRLNVLNPSLTPYTTYYPEDQIYNSWPFINSYPPPYQPDSLFNFGSNI